MNDPTETAQNGPETAQNGAETAQNGAETSPPDQLAELTAERDALALQVQRLTVAADKGIPVGLLTGTTLEELEDQAEQMLAFAATRRQPPDFGGGQRGDDTPRPATDPIREALRAGRRRL